MSEPKRIINTHDQLLAAREKGFPDVAILPRTMQSGRSTLTNGWRVYRPGFNIGKETDPFDGDYGCRVFSEERGPDWRKARQEALAKAVEWAGRKYKIAKFERNHMGDFVDDQVKKLFPLEPRARKKQVGA